MKSVFVSVILPAYNAENHINEAIESILLQSLKSFELIIINDGSFDNTEKLILSFEDKRITYVKNEVNKGLIYSLNKGLKLAKGNFIARMDADDISFPTRLEKQVEMMMSNMKIIVCGTQIIKFGNKSCPNKYFIDNQSIKRNMIYACPFAHPTVMMRRDVIQDNNILYDSNFKDAEDYKLWIDLMNYGDYYNLPEPLLQYRVSEFQISQSSNQRQKKSAAKCRRLLLSKEFHISAPEHIDLKYIQDNLGSLRDKKLLELFILSIDTYNLKTLIFGLRHFFLGNMSLTGVLRLVKRLINGSSKLL